MASTGLDSSTMLVIREMDTMPMSSNFMISIIISVILVSMLLTGLAYVFYKNGYRVPIKSWRNDRIAKRVDSYLPYGHSRGPSVDSSLYEPCPTENRGISNKRSIFSWLRRKEYPLSIPISGSQFVTEQYKPYPYDTLHTGSVSQSSFEPPTPRTHVRLPSDPSQAHTRDPTLTPPLASNPRPLHITDIDLIVTRVVDALRLEMETRSSGSGHSPQGSQFQPVHCACHLCREREDSLHPPDSRRMPSANPPPSYSFRAHTRNL